MSRRPGVGSRWLEKFSRDLLARGKVIVRGHENNPPRYYLDKLADYDAARAEGFQHARYLEGLAQREHQTPERLAVQETVQRARTKSLLRNLDRS